MSEDTARALGDAIAAEAEVRAATDRQKSECLAEIASGLPAKLKGLAKRWAHAEPDITRALGREGVEKLRAELSEESRTLAATIVGGVEKIQWPSGSHVLTREVHSALFRYLYGAPVDKITAVFERHGYNVRDRSVLPQDLYGEERLQPVADALSALSKAQRVTAEVKAADDHSAVEDIWGT